MKAVPLPKRLLANEAHAMLTRLDRLKPFALNMPMVPAAVAVRAQKAIDMHLASGRSSLRILILGFLKWLYSASGRKASPPEAQRRYTLLRLRFNAVLSQLDIFADALTQRGEHDTGIWLAGLDALARDALRLPGDYFRLPPIICYIDRGMGAAIRRARTRLPGGGRNPVAVIRVPRERMIGSGIGSSLIHEVGHQGAALLNLVAVTRTVLRRHRPPGEAGRIWQFYERWISEILADLWSVARLGISSTLGLMGVVSLPRPFVFRVSLNDPHPIPWFRVKLSCAMGRAFYPDPQWERFSRVWENYYPLAGLSPLKRGMLARLQEMMPRFVNLLLTNRPPGLNGDSVGEALAGAERTPSQLRNLYERWDLSHGMMNKAAPAIVFAALGQAKVDGALAPDSESRIIAGLLRHWALQKQIDPQFDCPAGDQIKLYESAPFSEYGIR